MQVISMVLTVSVVTIMITVNMAQLTTVICPVLVTGASYVEDIGRTWFITFLRVSYKVSVIKYTMWL